MIVTEHSIYNYCIKIEKISVNMRAASQLSGKGPTDVDVAPVPAR